IIGSELAKICLRSPDLPVGPVGRLVQIRLQLCSQAFHGFGVGAGRHQNWLDSHQRAPPERQVDGGAVPIVDPNETARSHREWHDWSSGFSRQHDETEPRNPRSLRNVRRGRDVIAGLKRAYHLLEGAHTALAVKRRTVIAGAADGANAEPLGGNGVELAVTVARDQHLGAVALLCLDKWGQKMLAVPERQDHGLRWLHHVIHMCRIEAEFIGAPYQAQVLGREKTNRALDVTAAQQIAKQFFQRAGFACWPGSSRRCRWTMK